MGKWGFYRQQLDVNVISMRFWCNSMDVQMNSEVLMELPGNSTKTKNWTLWICFFWILMGFSEKNMCFHGIHQNKQQKLGNFNLFGGEWISRLSFQVKHLKLTLKTKSLSLKSINLLFKIYDAYIICFQKTIFETIP